MRYATVKQVSYIDSLVKNREMSEMDPFCRARIDQITKRQAPGLSISEASGLISELRRCPMKAGTTAKEGYYVRDGRVYVVVSNKNGTATYAKRMEVVNGRGRWVYAPGLGRDIAREGLAPLTITEAARLGRLHGACMICGRPLTDPESVQRGIGPVCATKV